MTLFCVCWSGLKLGDLLLLLFFWSDLEPSDVVLSVSQIWKLVTLSGVCWSDLEASDVIQCLIVSPWTWWRHFVSSFWQARKLLTLAIVYWADLEFVGTVGRILPARLVGRREIRSNYLTVKVSLCLLVRSGTWGRARRPGHCWDTRVLCGAWPDVATHWCLDLRTRR